MKLLAVQAAAASSVCQFFSYLHYFGTFI